MKKIYIIFTAGLIILALSIKGDLEKIFQSLELNDDQQIKISELNKNFTSYHMAYQEERAELLMNLKELKYSPYSTKEEYGSTVDEHTALEIEFQKALLDYFFIVKDILNPDQWEDFTDEYFEGPLFDMPGRSFDKAGEGDMGMPEMMGPPMGGDDAPPEIGQRGGRMGTGGGPMGMLGGNPQEMKELGAYSMLNLTNDQKIVIKKILDEEQSHKEKMDNIIDDMGEEIEKMQTEGNCDKAAILQKIQEREQKRGESEKISFNYTVRIRQILNSQQRFELYSNMMNMTKRTKSRAPRG